ncbi:MAG: hypothetical protein ACF8R7_14455 [Phycisphaerales bacterium JB039]
MQHAPDHADTPASLTPIERDVALLALSTAEATAAEALAARLDLSEVRFLQILARPHVAAFIDASLAVEQMRADLAARRARTAALQTLTSVCQDEQVDPVERRRAATAILRISAAELRTRAGAPPAPTPAPGDRREHADHPEHASALNAALLARAMTHLAPADASPDDGVSTSPARVLQAAADAITDDDQSRIEKIRALCAADLRCPTTADFLETPHGALLRALAGAPVAASAALFEDGRWRCRRFTFQVEPEPVTLQLSCLDFGYRTPRWRIAHIAHVGRLPDSPADPAGAAQPALHDNPAGADVSGHLDEAALEDALDDADLDENDFVEDDFVDDDLRDRRLDPTGRLDPHDHPPDGRDNHHPP